MQPAQRVTVLVLGDLGRSPRMLNHAWALAQDGAQVALCGYDETPADRAVVEHPRIRLFSIRPLPRPREGISSFRFLLISTLRSGLLLIQSLWLLLVRTPACDTLLVQNPPCLPTLPAAWLAAKLRGERFVVDWHNFGFAMLALRVGPRHWLVRLSQRCERWFGSRADAHFCVSAAMRERLITDFAIRSAIVIRDQPRELLPLQPISSRSAAARAVLARAGIEFPDHTALAVCPTSWTADEDMNLLLEGLRQWDSAPAQSAALRLLVLITGRGPLRSSFEERLSGIPWGRVQVQTTFLDPADYRELLRAAHLGLCLHRSSSGVDLPMKIADLFGARTPACVLDYGECLREQMQPGVTAVTFRDSRELALRIDELLEGFPGDLRTLERMQRNIESSCTEPWQQIWQREAAPVFQRSSGPA